MKHWAKILAINALLLGFIAGYLMSAKQHNIVKFEPNEQQLGPIYEANPIKNWTSSEYVTYTDLNNNFNHLHANLGHGHGPIITANDISANAGIRPEQTTFGTAMNKNMVFNGTFKANPDGGANYILVNGAGSLSVNVSVSPGINIDGAANAGTLSDGGTLKYTVFYKGVGFVIGDTGLACVDQGSTVNLASPFHIAVDCYDLTDATPPSTKNPTGFAVLVYNNAL